MDYLVYTESFRLYLGYFKRATNQSSTISSVWEPLPDNCFLNISDDDEGTLEQLQCVENTFFSLGSIVEDPTVATQVVTDKNIIDNEERITMTCTILKLTIGRGHTVFQRH